MNKNDSKKKKKNKSKKSTSKKDTYSNIKNYEDVIKEPKVIMQTQSTKIKSTSSEYELKNENAKRECELEIKQKELETSNIKVDSKILTIISIFLILVSIILISAMIIMKKNNHSYSFKQIDIEEYINLYEKEDTSYVFITKDKCTYCDLLRENLKKLQSQYNIQILELNVENLTEEEVKKLEESNSLFDRQWQTPMILSIAKDKELNGIVGYKEYSVLSKFIEYSINPDTKNSFIEINLNKYLDLLKSVDTTIIYIGRNGDSVCDEFSKTLEEVSNKLGFKIYYLNTDIIDTEEGWNKLNNSDKLFNKNWFMPTIIIVKKGKIIDYKMEKLEKAELIEFFQNNLL